MARPVRKRESGYALLFIFLTVAIIGIMYYAAMPHVVFEAQRDQEEMLIDRGEQYKRAIQLYYRKFKKYPAKIEDLENTSGQRFLRQRYKDPMTGKDEWRPIHIGANGQFIDSLTQKSNQKKQDPASVNNFITEMKPLGDTGSGLNAPVGLGMRRRPSDGGAQNGDPNGGSPASIPGSLPETDQPLLDAPDNAVAGPNGSTVPASPGGSDLNGNAGLSPNGTAANGFNGNGFNTNGSNANGTGANNFNSNNSNNGFQNQTPVSGQNPSGADMIRNMLTSPRPGGPPPGIFPGQTSDGSGNQQSQFPQASNTTNVGGFNGTSGGSGLGGNTTGGTGSTVGTALGTPAGGQTIGGGGIAGFASKAERPGIKIYNEKTKYNEWEFIYDYAKDKTMGGGQTIPTQTGNGLNGTGTTGTGSGTGSASGSSGLGSGTGTSSGTGSSLGSSGGTTSPSSPTSPSTGP